MAVAGGKGGLRRRLVLCAALVLLVSVGAAACGKKGPVKPPLPAGESEREGRMERDANRTDKTVTKELEPGR